MSYEDCITYFSKKSADWTNTSPDGTLRTYINNAGKNGLIQEFRGDPEFSRIVCKFLSEEAAGGEQNALSNILTESLPTTSAELNSLIDAALEACGYKKEGVPRWMLGV